MQKKEEKSGNLFMKRDTKNGTVSAKTAERKAVCIGFTERNTVLIVMPESKQNMTFPKNHKEKKWN